MTDAQRHALHDAYTTLRALHTVIGEETPMGEMCVVSVSLLTQEFPELANFEQEIEKTICRICRIEYPTRPDMLCDFCRTMKEGFKNGA